MNSVFSVDDLTDPFWQPPATTTESTPADRMMIRSQSEWAFQKFLEEISVPAGSSTDNNAIGTSRSEVRSEPSVSRPEEGGAVSDIADVVEIEKPRNRAPSLSSAEIDPDDYQAILKSKLELACAAVALRVATVKPEDSSASSVNQTKSAPITSQSQVPVVPIMSPAGSSGSAAPSSGTKNKPDIKDRQATSGSSRDDSDDEDLDGDTETTENADPADVKRARRMLSNRESARRSRRRKQEQMNELDTQVGQLRAEHSTLLKRLSDMNQKYDMAAVDNRILKADIETLRTKVKMAEETVKRMTGMNPLLFARPHSIPFNSTPTDSSQSSLNHSTKPANSHLTGVIPNQRLANDFSNNSAVSLHTSPVSDIGLKISTKVPLPQNVASPNSLPEQVNSVVPTSCNAYEPHPDWNRPAGKNKPQE